jgi:hypothetical protein|tara:strand:+ start:6671 stop:6799 length:129 start_codon:yes stop_codon:yes gene_type:complete
MTTGNAVNIALPPGYWPPTRSIAINTLAVSSNTVQLLNHLGI